MHRPENHRDHNRIARATLCGAALAVLLSQTGCGKNEAIPTTAERLKAVQQRQETQPDFYVPHKSQVDYMATLKNIKDAPPPTPAPAPAPVPVPAPAKAEPVKAPEVAKAAPVQAAPAPAPVQAAPAQPTQVASAAPTARAPAPAAPSPQTVTVLKREQPDFPREAARAGVDTGTVRAKITIAANGDVSSVTIVSSNPPRIFDRAVRSSLERWKFNPGADGRTYETEIGFRAN